MGLVSFSSSKRGFGCPTSPSHLLPDLADICAACRGHDHFEAVLLALGGNRGDLEIAVGQDSLETNPVAVGRPADSPPDPADNACPRALGVAAWPRRRCTDSRRRFHPRIGDFVAFGDHCGPCPVDRCSGGPSRRHSSDKCRLPARCRRTPVAGRPATSSAGRPAQVGESGTVRIAREHVPPLHKSSPRSVFQPWKAIRRPSRDQSGDPRKVKSGLATICFKSLPSALITNSGVGVKLPRAPAPCCCRRQSRVSRPLDASLRLIVMSLPACEKNAQQEVQSLNIKSIVPGRLSRIDDARHIQDGFVAYPQHESRVRNHRTARTIAEGQASQPLILRHRRNRDGLNPPEAHRSPSPPEGSRQRLARPQAAAVGEGELIFQPGNAQQQRAPLPAEQPRPPPAPATDGDSGGADRPPIRGGLRPLQPGLQEVLPAAKLRQRGIGLVQLPLEVLNLLPRQLVLQAAGLRQQLRQPVATPLVMGHRRVHLLRRALQLLDVLRGVAAEHRRRPVADALPRPARAASPAPPATSARSRRSGSAKTFDGPASVASVHNGSATAGPGDRPECRPTRPHSRDIDRPDPWPSSARRSAPPAAARRAASSSGNGGS